MNNIFQQNVQQKFEYVYQSVADLIRLARANVLKSVNHEQILAYWQIGRKIVEEEQSGSDRAEYGKRLLQVLSEKLTAEFGRGFSPVTLRGFRQFYLVYKDRICSEPRSDSQNQIGFDQNLSWTHYKILMREERPNVRRFYEIEAAKHYWSTPQLDRQMNSFLFERLSASKDEASVLALANEGHVVRTPEDALKEPLILDFLGYKQHHSYTESDLENSIISHLQDFLLEMGSGFAFIGRQKRLTIEGDHFYPDLIFYHVILKCYVVIELKIKHISHEDVGQLLMYVNYYDRVLKQNDDGPTIGLLLCANKNDAVVRYTLPENNQQIFAKRYQLHLPTEATLIAELNREIENIKEKLTHDN